MLVEDPDQFIELLKKSNIASPEIVSLWLERVTDKSSAANIAKSLTKSDFITKWQAKFLLSGRSRIRFGNYILQQRIKSNDIGDYFVANNVNLNQKVNILFLSQDLSRKLDDRDNVLRLAASASSINHFGIEHLQAIERESGRFLIITDYHETKSLNSPDNLSRLNGRDVPQILAQIIDAVSAAHDAGLSHGTLTEQDVLFDGNAIKLQNLVASFLVHNLTDQYTGPVCTIDKDAAAIEIIGSRLLRRLEDSVDQADELKSILNQLGTRKSSLSATGKAIRELDSLARSTDASSTTTQEPPSTTPTEQSERHTDTTPSTPAACEIDTNPKRPWNRLQIVQTGFAAIALVGVGYLLYTSDWLNSSKPQTSSNEYQIKPVATDRSLPSLPTTTPQAQAPPTDSSPTEPPTETNLAFESTSTEIIETEISKLENPLESSTTNSSEAANPQSIDENPELLENTEDKTDSILSAFKSIRETKSSAAVDSSADPNTPADAQPIAESSFPKHISLPSSETENPKSVANIAGPLVDLELLSDENISKNKAQFELSGNSDSGWGIEYRSRDTSTKIANLELLDGQLNFSWTAQAKDIANTGFLSNCVLKIRSGGQTNYVNLRSPLSLSGFTLDRKIPKLKLEIEDLKFLPKNAVVELHEIDEEIYGPTVISDDSDVRTFSSKNPLQIHFRELPEYQMIFLSLESNLKNRSRLEAELQIQLNPAQKPVVADQKTTDQAKQHLQEQIDHAKAGIEYLGKPIAEIRAERNLSSQQFSNDIRNAQKNELKKHLELCEGRAEQFREILTQLEPFFQKPIPVSIYFEVQGQRVVLATTVFE